VRDAGVPARYPFVLVFSFVVTTGVSAASYYLLERPIMRWGSARARRRGGGAPRS
jgi:peptidoglycan/LPS O-acetylase OafA/YrhL